MAITTNTTIGKSVTQDKNREISAEYTGYYQSMTTGYAETSTGYCFVIFSKVWNKD